MNANTSMQTALFIAVLIALAIPLGRYMSNVLDGSSVVVRRIGRPVESMLYRIAGVDPDAEMSWKHYALAVLLFNVLGALALYALLRLQGMLLANPQGMAGVPGCGLQHGRQLRDQHQLAGLRRRKHAWLSRADARPHCAELPLGGHGHRGRRGADSRLQAA
ncbi:Potassium-transporting ATPase A chain [Candidatus Paraburkholderia kirkii]|nr:Potassium-transporting ATPase A chain [Candidatus Paraburkholderia kirkii]